MQNNLTNELMAVVAKHGIAAVLGELRMQSHHFGNVAADNGKHDEMREWHTLGEHISTAANWASENNLSFS